VIDDTQDGRSVSDAAYTTVEKAQAAAPERDLVDPVELQLSGIPGWSLNHPAREGVFYYQG